MPSSFELNPQQKKAVQTIHGPLLICAGAGSGKTQVLTSRIAHILSKKWANPGEVLACTFTNKAAKEMSNRVLEQIQDIPLFEPLWISTFHSTCSRILRENISSLPPRTSVIIYDSSDQTALIKKLMKENNIDENYFSPKSFKQQISLCKRMALSPAEAVRHPQLRFTEDFPKFYADYESALISAGAFDFEGLLLEVYKLLLNNEKVRAFYQEKFKFISIDEYQDTNHIQYLLVKLLAQKHHNICVVGDEDQSIYSWRGADISNILNFEKDFPNCQVIKLEQNYRSTNTIVSAASSLIQRNFSRIHKNLFTQNHTGDPIHVQAHWNDTDEARFTARTIAHTCEKKDSSFNDFAVFYRTNAQSRILEDQLRNRRIPYRIIGSLKFYDRAEVKDMIAYLRFLLNPKDELSLRRILNAPKKGIGKTTVERALTVKSHIGSSLYESLIHLAETASITKKTAQSILDFRNQMETIRADIPRLHLSEVYLQILNKTQYTEKLKQENTPESKNKLDNINELGNAIQQFEEERGKTAGLESFLEQMSLLSSEDSYEQSAVSLMTFHLSKGLEFDVVFMTGLEEGLFPLIQNIEDADVEEERRLAYVGMTRARKQLYLSYAKSRKRFGVDKKQAPSRFLKEISQNYLHHAHSYSRLRL